MANVINGTDLCLFITTGATKKCIALATSCKIAISHATRKIASKDSGIWEESTTGRISWTCDSEQLFTADFDNIAPSVSGFSHSHLLDLMIARTPITITFGVVATSGVVPQSVGTGKTMTGTAILTKCDLSAGDNSNVTYSISMEGTGALTHA